MLIQINEIAGTTTRVENLPEILTPMEWCKKLNEDCANHILYKVI